MDNLRTPEYEAEGGPSVTEFTSLAEALLFLNKRRMSDNTLYCIMFRNDVFYVTQFNFGNQLLQQGYQLIYGG